MSSCYLEVGGFFFYKIAPFFTECLINPPKVAVLLLGGMKSDAI